MTQFLVLPIFILIWIYMMWKIFKSPKKDELKHQRNREDTVGYSQDQESTALPTMIVVFFLIIIAAVFK